MTELDTDHMDRFLDRVEGMKSDSTYSTIWAALKHYDAWLTETNHAYDEVGPLDIEDFVTHLSSKGYAPASCGLYFNNVREYYKYLVRAGIVEENPAASVDRNHITSLTTGRRKAEEVDIIYVTPELVDEMLEHAPTPRL